MCEPVHISPTFSLPTAPPENGRVYEWATAALDPASAVMSCARERHTVRWTHGFACNVGRVAPQPLGNMWSKLLGNFGKERRRPCSATPSARRAFSNTFS